MEVLKKKVVSRKFYRERDNQYKAGEKFYDFIIKFEGDDESYGYSSSKNPPPYFNEGEEQEYTVETKPRKDGKGDFKVVKQYTDRPKYGGGGGYKFDKDDEKTKQKISSVAYSTSYAKDLAVAGKIPVEKVKDVAKELIDFMKSEIESI